jgi:hypothetical protein
MIFGGGAKPRRQKSIKKSKGGLRRPRKSRLQKEAPSTAAQSVDRCNPMARSYVFDIMDVKIHAAF